VCKIPNTPLLALELPGRFSEEILGCRAAVLTEEELENVTALGVEVLS
jgi:hypothetical protein